MNIDIIFNWLAIIALILLITAVAMFIFMILLPTIKVDIRKDSKKEAKQAKKKAIKELKAFFGFSDDLTEGLVPCYSQKTGKIFYLRNTVGNDKIFGGEIIDVEFY